MVKINFEFRILSRILRKTIPNFLYIRETTKPKPSTNLCCSKILSTRRRNKKGTERQSERNGKSELGYSSLLFVQWCVSSTACTIWTVNVSVPGEWRSPWVGALLALSLDLPLSPCVCVCVCVCDTFRPCAMVVTICIHLHLQKKHKQAVFVFVFFYLFVFISNLILFGCPEYPNIKYLQ